MELVHLDSLRQTSVYRHTASGSCIKSVVCITDAQRTELLHNYNIQRELQHRSVCRVGQTAEVESLTVSVEMEWAGDSVEAVCQQRGRRHWTESELLLLVENTTAALAYAQRQGVAHQNLHPQNLFHTAEGRYVVSDFAPKKWVESGVFHISTPPQFLCPVLRKAYALELLGTGSGAIRYNVHKSDVYSLGLIILYCLQPQSVSEFGNQSLVEKNVAGAALSEEFKAVLREMLCKIEHMRPDFTQLRGKVKELLTATVVSAVNSSVHVHESLQVLFRTYFSVQLLVQESPKVPQEEGSLLCKRCRQPINSSSMDWRVGYLGSSCYSESRGFCSNACFEGRKPPPDQHPEHRAEIDQPAEETLWKFKYTLLGINQRTDLPEVKPTARLCVQCGNAPEFFFLTYDCGIHVCCPQDAGSYIQKLNPGLLTECPVCLSKSTQMRLTDFIVYSNESYKGVFFKLINVSFEKNIGGVALIFIEGIYPVPLTQEFALELQRNRCHFCDGPTVNTQWKCLFHGGKPSIVCSSRCVSAYLPDSASRRDCTCPVCSETIMTSRVANALSTVSKFDSYWQSRCDGSCDLCIYGPAQHRLSCTHSFCERCLREFGKPVVENYFPCLFCGFSIHISEISI